VRRLVVLAMVAVLGGKISRAAATEVEGSVAADRPTVVVLEPLGGPPPSRPAPRVVMDQKNLSFVPAVLPVIRGTTIEFRNSDDVQHNVFSPSGIAGKFDLGTHGPGATRTVTLDEPGEVLILCNIHMEMEAHVLVLDTPYFTTATREGRYRITDVPAGSYTVRVWRGSWAPMRRTIDVPASGTVGMDLESER
jgi:plastocyanin